MKTLHILLPVLLVFAFCLPGYGDSANAAYDRGVQAEKSNNYDAAFEAYKQAHELKPKDPKFETAYTRLRFQCANEHVRNGQLLRDAGKLEEALTEFEKAALIDHSSFIAQQEVRRTNDMIRKQAQSHEPQTARPVSPLAKLAEEAPGPVELQQIPDTPTNLRMSETADKVYKVLAKLAGLNVLFDPDYHPPKITIELNDVTPREALDMVALQSKSFWQPVSSNTIFVAGDSSGKKKDLQGNVMKTFYLKNVSTPTELQEAANTVKGILDVTKMQLVPNQSAVILRGTPAQLILAEKLFADIDKPKAEVVIDVAVMQVSRDKLHTLGVNPPTSASIVATPSGPVVTGGNSPPASSGGNFTLNTIGSLNADNFQVSFPGATLSFLMSDSNTKLIQNPEIRALDNEKATLKIGDRVPIATGSFAPGIGGGAVSPLVNTQFQYLDVGVNIDIVPHVHSEDDVTLKMVLEISSVTGTQNIGGISQPVIGQRRIEHETRLRDGEVNLLGGILETTETNSLSGYPWLTKIPILKYLFGQESKDQRENEIVFAITPHILRAQELNDQNLRLVDVGTGNSVELRPSSSRSAVARGKQNDPNAAKSAAPNGSPATPQKTPAPQNSSTPQTPALPQQNQAGTAKVVPTNQPPTSAPPQNSQTGTPPANTAMSRPPSTSPALPQTARAPSSPPSQGAPDPCPFGQHSVGVQNGVVNCAFD
jgi:general secretion pathway protein D